MNECPRTTRQPFARAQILLFPPVLPADAHRRRRHLDRRPTPPYAAVFGLNNELWISCRVVACASCAYVYIPKGLYAHGKAGKIRLFPKSRPRVRALSLSLSLSLSFTSPETRSIRYNRPTVGENDLFTAYTRNQFRLSIIIIIINRLKSVSGVRFHEHRQHNTILTAFINNIRTADSSPSHASYIVSFYSFVRTTAVVFNKWNTFMTSTAVTVYVKHKTGV